MDLERLVVVGGGIAGLSVAAGLGRAGYRVEVVERVERWAPVGAGITLGANAMAVLRGLDVHEALMERGAVLGRGAITDARGRELMVSDFEAVRAELGPTVAVHRAALHEALLGAAEAAGATVTLGTSVESIGRHDDGDAPRAQGADPHAGGVAMRLTDAREVRADLLIGADGVRSHVRELVFGPTAPRYAGYTCWRLVVRAPAAGTELREMWGRGRRFGIVPIGGGRVYAFATANAPAGADDPYDGRLERFRARFADFGGQVPEVLAALEHPDELLHNDIEELPPHPWRRGRALLIGDAAHALTPNLGQGAAMALEDAAVLVRELAAAATPNEALDRFVARREPRVRAIQARSRRLGTIAQLEGRAVCALRDALLRCVPASAGIRTLRQLASGPG